MRHVARNFCREVLFAAGLGCDELVEWFSLVVGEGEVVDAEDVYNAVGCSGALCAVAALLDGGVKLVVQVGLVADISSGDFRVWDVLC